MHDLLTLQHDNKFESIKGLKYLPWVGYDYKQSSPKILVIGESVYNWGKTSDEKLAAQAKLNDSSFVRTIVIEHGIDKIVARRNFFRGVEKLLGGDSDTIWKNYAFHEFIQRPLSSVSDRPHLTDAALGGRVLIEVLKVLRPEKCLFMSTSYDKFLNVKTGLNNNGFTTSEEWPAKRNGAKPKILKIDGLDSKIYFLKHPSRGFDANVWVDFINNY